jgi:hypothetical protein
MLDRQADAAEHPHKASNTAEVLDPVIKTLIKTSRFAHSPEGYVPQQLRQWLSWEGVWVRLDNLGRLGQCKGQPESWRPGPLEFGVTTGLPGREGYEMIRKALLFMIPLAVAGAVAGQRQDIARYLKIKQMSSGTGHPENVPAGGSQAYPQPGRGAADGTGDFGSASRGGPFSDSPA